MSIKFIDIILVLNSYCQVHYERSLSDQQEINVKLNQTNKEYVVFRIRLTILICMKNIFNSWCLIETFYLKRHEQIGGTLVNWIILMGNKTNIVEN